MITNYTNFNASTRKDKPTASPPAPSSDNIEIIDISESGINDVYFGSTDAVRKSMRKSDNESQSKSTSDQPEDFFFFFEENPKLVNDFTIYFPCTVSKDSVDISIDLLKKINRKIAIMELEHPELKGKLNIKFMINSGGGHVVQGLRLFDAIKNNPYPVTTIATGIAGSMGIVILTAGQTVLATENTTVMIHQLSAGVQGKFHEMKDHMDFWVKLQSKLCSLIVNNTKAKKEDIEKFMKGESYILANDAIKLGIVDALYKPNMY